MKKYTLYLLAIIFYLLFFNASYSYAGNENCPKESIHCVSRASNGNNISKWIKVVMLPKNISMVICMSNNDVLYLEKDDIEQDGIRPGTVLTWQLSQCFDEKCIQSLPLGIDQFTLLFVNNHYSAIPPSYNFTINPNYGETCTFPARRLRLRLGSPF